MRRPLIALTAAVLLLATAACSSSDETAESVGTTAPAEEATTTTAEATEATKRPTTTKADDEDEDGAGTTTTRRGGTSSVTLPDGDFCEVLTWMDETDQGDEDIPEEEVMALFAELANRAPAELQNSFRVFIDMIEKLEKLENLENLDEDDPQAFGEAMAILFTPEVMAALSQISTYAMTECGIDMDMMGMDDLGFGQ